MMTGKNLTNPYVGPRPFERHESGYFFGREEEIVILSGLVVAHQLSLFFAQSGAGKSSLLQAGLVPRLTRKMRTGIGADARLYQTMHVLPIVTVGRGVPPRMTTAIENVFVFSALLGLLPDADADALARLSLRAALTPLLDDGMAAGAIWEPAQERNGRVRPPLLKPDATLLIIDQFEELFTVHPEQWSQREEFFRQVDEALARFPTLHVLLSMREDYLAELTPFANLLTDDLRHRFRMERLRRAGALLAVSQPALAAGRTFASGVAEELVDNLRRVQRSQQSQRFAQERQLSRGAEPHLAPLYGDYVEPVHLQIVCRDLWAGLPPEQGEIQRGDLQTFGDVDQALTNFYESTLAQVVAATDVSERALRRWFSEELITPARTKGLVYRDEEKGETEGLVNRAVDMLRDAWIVRGDMRGGDTWYELAHDRLVEPILAANQLRQTPLALDAQAWLDAQRAPNALYEGQQLRDLATELEEHADRFSELEREFIQVGLERERRRSDRRRQLVLTGAAVIILILIVLTGVTYNSSVSATRSEATARAAQGTADTLRQESVATATVAIANATSAFVAKENADEQRGIAERASNEAIAAQQRAIEARTKAEQQRQIAQANQLAADSIVSLGLDSQLERSLLLSIEAMNAARTIANQRSPAAEEALRQALRQAEADPMVVDVGESPIQSITFSPDAQSLLIWRENALEQSNPLDEKVPLLTLRPVLTETATMAELSPHGRWLVVVTEGGGGGVQLLDLTTAATTRASLGATPSAMPTLAFSDDERWLVLGGALVEVWDLTKHTERPTTMREAGSPPTSVAISRDGRWLAAASQSGFIRLWDLQSNAEPVLLNGHEAPAQTLVVSPDQKWLISGGADHTVRFWPLTDAVVRETILRGHEAAVTALAFSSDGDRLATGSWDQTIRIWNMNNLLEKPLVLRSHEAPVQQIRFSSDGRWMVSAEDSGTLLLWRDQVDSLIRLACAQTGRNLTVQEWREFMSDPAYRQTCPDLPEAEIQLLYRNRDVVYAFLAAGRELHLDGWQLLQSANLFHLIFHYSEPYTGPNIAELSGLTLEQQEVVRRKLLREANESLTTAAYLWRKSELLTIPLAPPPAEQVVLSATADSAEERMIGVWNRFGSLMAAIAMELEIDADIPVAWLVVESGGNNSGPDGRIIIRFENHIFYNEWGKAHPVVFAQHFRFDADTPWQGHQWRSDPTQAWQDFHGNQASEWQVYEFARTLDDTAAKRAISMGASQIIGFQHTRMGFQSVQDMFAVLTSPRVGERNGIFLSFDLMSSDPTFLDALRRRDFVQAATLYNGPGQAQYYAQFLQERAESFKQLRDIQQPLALTRGEAVMTTSAELAVWATAGEGDPTEGEIVGRFAAGVEGTILDGPVQVDDVVWWQIRFLDETTRPVEGWVAQTDATGHSQLERRLPQPPSPAMPTPGVGVTNLTGAGDFVVTRQAVAAWSAAGEEANGAVGGAALGTFEAGTNLVILDSLRRANQVTWWKVGGITPDGELVGWIAETASDGTATFGLPAKLPGTNIPDKATRAYLAAPFERAYGISQLFGENAAFYARFSYDGVALKGRNGVDFLTPVGTRVLAVDDGTVLRAESDPAGLGTFVLLQHGWGESLYAQLDSLAVAVGDAVSRGQMIGESGNSGASAGPHLGFSIRINPYDRADGWGGFADPLPYLNPEFISLPSYIMGN